MKKKTEKANKEIQMHCERSTYMSPVTMYVHKPQRSIVLHLLKDLGHGSNTRRLGEGSDKVF